MEFRESDYFELESSVIYDYTNQSDIIIFKNVIKKEECEFIINTIENRCEWREATTFGNQENYRKTKVIYLTQIFGIHSDVYKAHNILGYAFKTCVEQLMKIYKFNNNNNIVSHIKFNGDEGFQVLKYEGSNYYKEHIDGGFNSEVKRVISFLFYLNDDFEGGETYFPRQDITVTPSTGSVLIFPSIYTHPHEAKPITNGIKYSSVIWSY